MAQFFWIAPQEIDHPLFDKTQDHSRLSVEFMWSGVRANDPMKINRQPDAASRHGPEPAPCSQNAIWDYYQTVSPESFAGNEGRINFLISRIAPSLCVLNIGCGNGRFEELAAKRGIRIHSCDPSAAAIENLRQRLDLGERAKVGTIAKLPFADGTFDVVVVSEVLEHLTPVVMAAGLGEIRRVLKEHGRILGTVPADEDLREQQVVCPHCAQVFHRWGHEQSFTLAGLRKPLEAEFAEVIIQKRPFISWGILNWKGRCFAIVKWLLWRLGIHGSGEHYFFEAKITAKESDLPAHASTR